MKKTKSTPRARVSELERYNEALNALVRSNSSQSQGDIDSFCANYSEVEALKQRNAELEAALRKLAGVLKERHHGRMPAEVQEAYDGAWDALARHRAKQEAS